jgi:hypothetical protein
MHSTPASPRVRALIVLTVLIVLALSGRGRAEDAPTGSEAAPAPAAPGPTGAIAGKVLDTATGEPIIDAGVEIVGSKRQTRTDVDGRFDFKVAPGTYELRVFAPGYQGARITGIAVEPGKLATANATLNPAAGAGVEVVEVVAKANKAAEATQMLERKSANVVEDTVSAEIIAKSPDSDAAEIVERVPAVTVKDDKYVFVRGLGERYSSALLNGNRLPSPDPNKRVVPLDLFPAQFIDSIAIIKSYSPDLPGDFSGGLVDINLRSFPDVFTAKLGMSIGGTTTSTFQPFKDFDGSGNALGIAADNGLPSIFGSKTIGAPPAAQAGVFASKLPNVWTPFTTTAPPNFGLNFQIGNSWGPLGMTLGTNWTNAYKVERNRIERQFANTGDVENPVIELTDDFRYQYNVAETGIGAVYTAGYDFNPDNRINFRALYNRNTENRVELGTGVTSQNEDQINNITRLEYGVDDLVFGQFQGQDHTDWFDVDWRTAFARSTENLPDTRTTDYVNIPDDPTAPPIFVPASQGGTRVFFDITEYMSDSAVDFTIPFRTWLPFTEVWDGLPARLKLGPAYMHRERVTDLRSFRYLPRGAQDLSQPPDELLAPDRVGQGLVGFEETTAPRDSFSASEDVAAFYGLFDLPIVRDLLRLVAGVRTEYSYIHLTTHDDSGRRIENNINNLDPLPSVALIASPREDMQVRFGWSQTVSRPEFRELSPVFYPEPRGLRPTIGNPFLVESNIDNLDLRWDWFLSPLELVSLSLFMKNIDKPIEEVVIAQSSNVANSFTNAKSADLMGIEGEVRKNFEFVTPPLKYLSFVGNAALIDSDVTAAPRTPTQVQTSSNRPLQGQSPFVVNLMLDYTHPAVGTARLLYQVSGRSIAAVGAYGLPDIYEEKRNQLDFVFVKQDVPIFGQPFDLKFTAENLVNDRYLFTQGGETQERYVKGVTLSFGLSYNF